MKHYAVFSTVVILGALFLSACGIGVLNGSGNVVSESRAVSGFNAIAFSGSGDVIINQGDTESLEIEADENLLSHIRTVVRGRTLHIYFEPGGLILIHPTHPIKFHVSMKEVASLDISGAGTIYADKVTTDALNIDISGSGDATIDNLRADDLRIDISGSGKCLIKGDVTTQRINISGSGNCNSSGLSSRNVSIDVSGSGKAQVNATGRLDIDISGSGDVIYSGTPKISQDVSGSGKISAK